MKKLYIICMYENSYTYMYYYLKQNQLLNEIQRIR
jgi:hypothetical protein